MTTTVYPAHLQSPLNLACIQCNVTKGTPCIWKGAWARRAEKAEAAGEPLIHCTRLNRLRRMREIWLSRETEKAQRARAKERGRQTRLEQRRAFVITPADHSRLRVEAFATAQREQAMLISTHFRTRQESDAAALGFTIADLEQVRVDTELTKSYAREDAFRDRIEPCWKCRAPRKTHFSSCCD